MTTFSDLFKTDDRYIILVAGEYHLFFDNPSGEWVVKAGRGRIVLRTESEQQAIKKIEELLEIKP